MPSRWFVPVSKIDPQRVRLEHVHAAFSRWFDHSPAEHAATEKPYTLSPLTRDAGGVPGLEIATLNATARQRLLEACADSRPVRLGNQTRTVGEARLLHSESWKTLTEHEDDVRWQLALLTPTTFRNGDRSTPLLRLDTLLDGLSRVWSTWSDVDLPGTAGDWSAVWLSDLEVRSVIVPLRVRRRDGSVQPVTVSGALGEITLRCEDRAVAARVGPLLRLAEYSGIGSMTLKGLGVVRVRPTQAVARAKVSLATTEERALRAGP
jgi:hypothetical protein